jgi:hypothetical protein
MGNGYSIAFTEGIDDEYSMFLTSKLISPVYIIGLENIIYYPSVKSMKLEGKRGYFIITQRKSIFDRKISIYRKLTGDALKLTLKKAGIVTRINDYYIFTNDIKRRVLIYDSHMNRKLFDYRGDSIFNFHLYETYDVYIF